MTKPIYLDYAATTPVDTEVLKIAQPYYKSVFYNPSSVHMLGQAASNAVEKAREQCAAAICCDPCEIYFTSGGTEAINWALRCATCSSARKHIVVSAIEHDSVLATAQYLKKIGFDVDYVMPTGDGIITPSALSAVIRSDTALVCVMAVNNQIGTVQPIKELAEISHAHGALLFSDCVQAVNTSEINVRSLGVDMAAVSGHKFYSPKGAGFLFVRSGVLIDPLILGGGQERGLRAGTVNVPSVVAMGAAIDRAVSNRDEYKNHIKLLRDEFLSRLEFGRPVADGAPRIDDIVTIVFDGINGGRLAVALSYSGVCCSVGAACSAGSAVPPHTLTAMGEKADNAVRFSFGKPTTLDQVIRAARIVNGVVRRMKN